MHGEMNVGIGSPYGVEICSFRIFDLILQIGVDGVFDFSPEDMRIVFRSQGYVKIDFVISILGHETPLHIHWYFAEHIT